MSNQISEDNSAGANGPEAIQEQDQLRISQEASAANEVFKIYSPINKTLGYIERQIWKARTQQHIFAPEEMASIRTIPKVLREIAVVLSIELRLANGGIRTVKNEQKLVLLQEVEDMFFEKAAKILTDLRQCQDVHIQHYATEPRRVLGVETPFNRKVVRNEILFALVSTASLETTSAQISDLANLRYTIIPERANGGRIESFRVVKKEATEM